MEDHGYRVTVMTGVAWGTYGDYLRGDFGGKEHWNETQQEADGPSRASPPAPCSRSRPRSLRSLRYLHHQNPRPHPPASQDVLSISLIRTSAWCRSRDRTGRAPPVPGPHLLPARHRPRSGRKREGAGRARHAGLPQLLGDQHRGPRSARPHRHPPAADACSEVRNGDGNHPPTRYRTEWHTPSRVPGKGRIPAGCHPASNAPDLPSSSAATEVGTAQFQLCRTRLQEKGLEPRGPTLRTADAKSAHWATARTLHNV